MLEPLTVALKDVNADEAELWTHRRRSAITRYAKNESHQNALADETYVQARGPLAGAAGLARANSVQPRGAAAGAAAPARAHACKPAELLRLLPDAPPAAELSVTNKEWPGFAPP